MWKDLTPYDLPPQDDAEATKVKRLAARCGRAYRKRAQFAQLKAKLVELMRGLDTRRLGYWAAVVMIDDRWCGATGQGAYWAVASECCNQAARQVLQERGTGGCPYRPDDHRPHHHPKPSMWIAST